MKVFHFQQLASVVEVWPDWSIPEAGGQKLAFGYTTLDESLDDRLLTAGQCAANCDPPADQKACSNTNMYAEVQRFREVMADVWSDVQLIHAVSCQPRGGVFENKIAILPGSNSEFLTETRPLSMWLDVEQLYLSRKHDEKALRLLPFGQSWFVAPFGNERVLFFQ